MVLVVLCWCWWLHGDGSCDVGDDSGVIDGDCE